MLRRLSSTFVKWLLTLALLSGLCAAAYFVHGEMQVERAREASGDKVQSPRRARDGIVDLGVEMAERLGVQDEAAKAVPWSEQVPVYGRVVPNPRATSEVRSPFPGTLRANSEKPWPAPGQWVRSGEVLGLVDVRVGPQERLALQNTLNDARLKYQGVQEVLKVQEDRVKRLKKLESGEVISRKELDDALVALADAKTQVATTKASVELYEKALERIGGGEVSKDSPWQQPLTAPGDGEVTQLLGRAGMAVEAGSVVLQLVDFRRPLVRLDFAPLVLREGAPLKLTLYPVSATPSPAAGILDQPEGADRTPPARATLIGPAPQIDLSSQFVPYWYEVEKVPPSVTGKKDTPADEAGSPKNALWRPGLQVKAYLKAQNAKPQEAISVPATAVLFHAGRALVYMRREAGKYERREVRLLGREEDRWVLARSQGLPGNGVAPGEAVVFRQAQVLLSEEFRGDVGND